MRTRFAAAGLLAILLATTCALAAEKGTAADVLGRIGVRRGYCVLLGDKGAALALDLARASDLTLLVQLADYEQVREAGQAVDAAGLYGTRILVAKCVPGRIGLATDVADAVIAAGDSLAMPRAEVLRVLHPGAKALLGQEELTKPAPQGVDDWSHHYHGPDNNPQSLDRLARAPYLTQFIAEPRYGPCPQAAVASAGRLFMAFGNVAWHEREEPWLDTLVAVNGYNGTLLWKRQLPSGIMVDRGTMIATPDTLYLAEGRSCRLLDPATGEPTGEIVAPADLAGGTFWKWMALEGGVLYALVGQPEAPDPVARWRSTHHGWPWGGISKGYNAGQFDWGFARTLLAIDPKTRKVLWTHQEDPPIDSRGTAMRDGRIYISSFGHYIACLDAKTGKDIWRRTAEGDTEVFQAIGPYRPGHGYIEGWKTTVYLKCTDKALYFVGPQVNWLTALSAADGRVLWKHPAKDLHIVVRDDGLYTIGAQNTQNDSKKLDPMTGAVLASYQTHRRACTRSTGGPDGVLFRASGGSGRLDAATGKMQWISAMRPSCHVGVVIASGHLYWLPWVCDCNLQMFGLISLGPAGEFAFGQQAAAERLEKFPADASASPPQADGDWPTYRANSTRTAATQAEVPGEAKLLWQAALKAEPTAPVAAGGLVYLGASDGIVRAFDAATGKPRWAAYTGGAIHYPPTLAGGRAFVGSDDGFAYALAAGTGSPIWRFRAAPAERRIPIYGQLLSTWPVASGVLVEGGVAYFAAGLNDFDGTHVYALDADTGAIRWQNNTCGHLDAESRRGVACQGELLLHEGKLYLAGGNAVSPGIFDAANGKCLNAPPTGMGTNAPRGRELYLAGGQVKTWGQPLHSVYPVFDGSCRWDPPVVAAKNARLTYAKRKDGPGWLLMATKLDGSELWTQPLPAEPVRWGLALDAAGRIAVALQGGQVLCFGR